jgi:pimeloyl-ACP methyl ester carboxylesterase
MEFVKVTTSDNIIFQGLLSEPSKKTKTAILHIHGMRGNLYESSFIKTMLNSYPSAGVSFLTVETRGSELMRFFPRVNEKPILLGNAYEIFEDSAKDIIAWIVFLKKRGYTKIHLQGHSLGCAKVAFFHSVQKDKCVKSLLFISPSDILGLELNPRDMPFHRKYAAEAKELEKQGKSGELLDGFQWDYYRLSAKTYLNISQEKSKTAIFNYNNPELGWKTVKKLDVPILSILGTKDEGIVTDAYESTKTLEKQATQCPRFVGIVLEGAPHSFVGFEHNIVEHVLELVLSI